MFPKQFIVGVLNATLDQAASAYVCVAGLLGSEMVLSPIVSLWLPLASFMGRWVLVGAAAFLDFEMVLKTPFMWGRVLLGVAAFLVSEMVLTPFDSLWLPSSCGGCWLLGSEMVLTLFAFCRSTKRVHLSTLKERTSPPFLTPDEHEMTKGFIGPSERFAFHESF